MLRKAILGVFMAVLCGLAGTVANATTYYVSTTGSDANNGTTEASPWRTVAHAAAVVVAGDTIFVRGGTYLEGLMWFKKSGTATAPIRLLNYPGESPIIDCNNVSTNMILIEPTSALAPLGYYVIEGFEIRKCYAGIKWGHLRNTVIRKNWIHNNRTQGILGNSGMNNLIDRNVVNSNGSATTQDHGIYANGRAMTITNNVIYDNMCFGIQHNGAKNFDSAKHPGREWEESQDWLIANNTIAYQRNCSGIVEWGPHADNTRIENNILYENRVNGTSSQSNGIHFVGIGGATGSLGILIRNNHVYASGSGGLTLFTGLAVEGVNYTQSGNIVNVSGPSLVNDGNNALPASPDFRLTSSSPVINAGRNRGAAFCGSAPDIGAFEACPPVGASINGQLLDVTFASAFPPVIASGTAGWSVSCTGTGCGTPSVSGVSRLTGSDTIVRLVISGITGGTCKSGQLWKVSYNSATGLVAHSSLVGGTLNQPVHSFTNFSTSNVCTGAPPPTPTIGSLTPATLSIQSGGTGTLTVTVTLNATQTSGTTVTLSSSLPSIATVPATVLVPANQLSEVFTVTAVSAGVTVVTASLNATQAQSTVTIEASPPPPPTAAVVSLLPASVTVTQGESVNLTVGINAAQATNTSVPTTSSSTAIATVPASVTVLAGQTSAIIPVTSVLAGATTITATLNGSANSAVTVAQPPPPPPPGSPHFNFLLDGNSNDSSGNALHGVATGGSFVDAKNNQGYLGVDGTLSTIDIPYGSAVNPSSQSLTLIMGVWVPDGATTVAKAVFGTLLGTNQRFYISMGSGTWRLGIQASADDTASDLAVRSGWNRLCLRVNSGTDVATLYNNGVPATTAGAVKSYTSYTLPSNFTIGAPLGGTTSGAFIYDDVQGYTSLVSCEDDWANWNQSVAGSDYKQSGHRFQRVYRGEAGAPVDYGGLDATVNVVRGGAVAVVMQLDCTPGPCPAMSPRLRYSLNGGAFSAVPDVPTTDGISFWGAATVPILNNGLAGLALKGSLTHTEGITNARFGAVPTVAGDANSSITIRHLVLIADTVPVGTVVCFKEYNQDSLQLLGYTPGGGACMTVIAPQASMGAD